jgi:hypothetical protein
VLVRIACLLFSCSQLCVASNLCAAEVRLKPNNPFSVEEALLQAARVHPKDCSFSITYFSSFDSDFGGQLQPPRGAGQRAGLIRKMFGDKGVRALLYRSGGTHYFRSFDGVTKRTHEAGDFRVLRIDAKFSLHFASNLGLDSFEKPSHLILTLYSDREEALDGQTCAAVVGKFGNVITELRSYSGTAIPDGVPVHRLIPWSRLPAINALSFADPTPSQSILCDGRNSQ